MGELGLVGRRRRRFQATTDSKHPFPVAANMLMRDFEVPAPNTAWVTDITYVATAEGWLYLAVILDLYSRRVVGFALSDRITRELVLEALRRALAKRPGVRDLIHHSDRGSQGGFKGSSQHLEREELRWGQADIDERIVLYGLECVHLVVRRSDAASIGCSSGKESAVGYRARRRPWQPACLPLSEHAGSARVAGWRRSLSVPCRGATYRSSSAKRSLSFMPGVAECVRSPADWTDPRRRSRANCVGTPQLAMETWSTEPRPPSGTPTGERDARRSRNSLRATS